MKVVAQGSIFREEPPSPALLPCRGNMKMRLPLPPQRWERRRSRRRTLAREGVAEGGAGPSLLDGIVIRKAGSVQCGEEQRSMLHSLAGQWLASVASGLRRGRGGPCPAANPGTRATPRPAPAACQRPMGRGRLPGATSASRECAFAAARTCWLLAAGCWPLCCWLGRVCGGQPSCAMGLRLGLAALISRREKLGVACEPNAGHAPIGMAGPRRGL